MKIWEWVKQYNYTLNPEGVFDAIRYMYTYWPDKHNRTWIREMYVDVSFQPQRLGKLPPYNFPQPTAVLTGTRTTRSASSIPRFVGRFVVLKGHDVCRSIADVELIPKMRFYQNRTMGFFKRCIFVSDTKSFSFAVCVVSYNSRHILSSLTEYLGREEHSLQKSAQSTIHASYS